MARQIKGGSKNISLRITIGLYNKIAKQSKEENRSMAGVCKIILAQYYGLIKVPSSNKRG